MQAILQFGEIWKPLARTGTEKKPLVPHVNSKSPKHMYQVGISSIYAGVLHKGPAQTSIFFHKPYTTWYDFEDR